MKDYGSLIENIIRKRRYNSKVSKIISQTVNVTEKDFNAETVIEGLNGADALDIMEIIINVEIEYNIEIPDNMFTKFVTVGDFYDYIKNVTGGKNRC